MPSKKKKYNARFPAGRIKKIMQTDEEVGKVAQAVPIIISRTLELFVESLLTKSMNITLSRNAKTLTPSHMKQCILSESRFDFLKDLVKNIPDASVQEDNENNALDEINDMNSIEEKSTKPAPLTTYFNEQSTSAGRTPVIQFSPKINNKKDETFADQIKIGISHVNATESSADSPKINFTIDTSTATTATSKPDTNIHIDLSAVGNQLLPPLVPISSNSTPTVKVSLKEDVQPPALIPIASSIYGQHSSDNLYIDEDYDN